MSILAVSSLLATAYILLALPLDASLPSSSGYIEDTPRPLQQYLPYLNIIFALLIAFDGLVSRRTSNEDYEFSLLCVLPAGMELPKP